jgi:hypothetical protein
MTSNELEVLMFSYLIFQNNLKIMVTKITFDLFENCDYES